MSGAERAPHLVMGERAEQLASAHLSARGYALLERNYRPKGSSGEIDLIVERGVELVFVEVRYRRSSAYGAPEETVRRGKQRRILLAAMEYVAKKRLARRAIRFDIISITEGTGGPEGPILEHFEDAFDADLPIGSFVPFV